MKWLELFTALRKGAVRADPATWKNAQVAVNLILLIIAPSIGYADALDDYVAAHNARKPLVMLPESAQQHYWDNPDWGRLTLTDKTCVGAKCLAQYTLARGNKIYQTGWLLTEEDAGRLVAMYPLETDPGASWGPEAGQAADVASTALALSQGLSEANPAGPVGTLGLKIASLMYLSGGTLTLCMNNASLFKQAGYGLATWNTGLTALWVLDHEPVSKIVLAGLAGGAAVVFHKTKMSYEESWATCARYAMADPDGSQTDQLNHFLE